MDPDDRRRWVALIAGMLLFGAAVAFVWIYPPG